MKKLAYKWECDYLAPKMGLYASERCVVRMMAEEPCVTNISTIDSLDVEINGTKYKVHTSYEKRGCDPIWIEFQGRKLYINKSKGVRFCHVEDLVRDINRVVEFIKREQ